MEKEKFTSEYHVGDTVVSDTQIYRMCGNGWTVKVIEHILGNLFI